MTPASRLYEGQVRHRRFAPVPHAFRYRMFMLYLALEELPEILDAVPFWSARRPAPARFRRKDYLGDPRRPLDEAVRSLVEERTGQRPGGPVRLLTHLRYFGYVFNPVSFYYVLDETGGGVRHIVADVTNTPWNERHAYVLSAEDGPDAHVHRFELEKEFHVSPFMDMNHHYVWRFTPPGDRLVVHMENHTAAGRLFDATLDLERRPFTGKALNRALLRYPFMTLKVIAAIHLQALRLWMKRVPFHPHPAKRAAPPTSPAGGQDSR